MITIYKTIGQTTAEIQEFEDKVWIHMAAPTQDELETVRLHYNIDEDHLRSCLDEEERPRIDVEEESTLFIIDVPVEQEDPSGRLYGTMPMGIIIAKDAIITVCTVEVRFVSDLMKGRTKGLYTHMKTRMILQIMLRVASYYILYLRKIDKVSVEVEAELHKSMKNQELIQLLALEKSLVYFSSSLSANEMVFEKMMRLDVVKQYPDDRELLEDVIIENKQAIEMANIYSNILSGTLGAFASVISNNLNIVMKFLASMTIVMAVPTIISSFYGMNVSYLPFSQGPGSFFIVLLMTFVLTGAIALYMFKKKLF